MRTIVDILYLEEYKLLLLLNNGSEQVVNLENTVKNQEFESLREKKTFSKFFINNGTLAWPNGTGINHNYLLNMIPEEMALTA